MADSNKPSGVRGALWWLRSRKAQAAVATLIVLIAGDQFGIELTLERVAGIVSIATALILGIAHEDAAEKRKIDPEAS